MRAERKEKIRTEDKEANNSAKVYKLYDRNPYEGRVAPLTVVENLEVEDGGSELLTGAPALVV